MRHAAIRTGWVGTLMAAAMAVTAVGCGDDDGGGGPAPTPTPTRAQAPTPTLIVASSFAAIAPPQSPNDTGGILGRPPAAQASGSTAAPPAFNHWFYLVNGTGLPEQGSTALPNVLAVTGPPPSGAPAPNGGTAVSVQALDPQATGQQLWKAVSAPGSGQVFLRSGVSFRLNDDNNPSPLTGWAANGAPLDLGEIAGWDTSVFWNQLETPAGDISQFQQWSYDPSSAQLSVATGGQLYDDGGAVDVGTATSAPGNQWYAFPNYLLERVVMQPNANPPFPTFPFPPPTAAATPPPGATPTPTAGASGEQAAYDYLSDLFIAGSSGSACEIEGAQYSGIRCEYTDLDNTATFSTCAATCLDQYLALPAMPDDLPSSVSPTDWAAVTWQLYQECLYVSQVQDTFNTYNAIFTQVFDSDSSQIPSLADDVGLSASTNVNVVAIDVIEGMLYTLLGATGDPGAGVFANLMSMSVNTGLAAGGANQQALTQQITTTAADLYDDLGKQIAFLGQQASNGENAILQDWGRLQIVGPLSQRTGYNSLGISADQESAIVAAAAKGYALTVMQALLPLAYQANVNVAGTFDQFEDIPSYDQYAYPAFGSDSQNYNTGYLNNWDHLSNYPSQTVMQTDIYDNGGNAFELFNALNGWNQMRLVYNNFICYGAVLTLFNSTPNDLWVSVVAPQGLIAAPGAEFNAGGEETGSGGPATYELRPFGYLPIFTATNGPGERNMTINVQIFDYDYSTTASVASFDYGTDGCAGHSPINAWEVSAIDGYALGTFNLQTDSSLPQGIWTTIYRSE